MARSKLSSFRVLLRSSVDINVYFQNNDYVKQLVSERDEAEARAREWERKFRDLDRRVADIMKVNIELCDTLRANKIRFRCSADSRNW